MEPPCLKLYETAGIPLPNSTLEMNFGWYLRIYQLIGGISHMLWWLDTMIRGTFSGISGSIFASNVVPSTFKHRIRVQLKASTLFLCALYPNQLKQTHWIP